MWENAYLSVKNTEALRALKQTLDPTCTLLTSLVQLRFATLATFRLRSWPAPLDQILDPHLAARIDQLSNESAISDGKLVTKHSVDST